MKNEEGYQTAEALRETFRAGAGIRRQAGASAIGIEADCGTLAKFGGLGFHWKIDLGDTGGHFSIVHHPMAPRALAAPLHRHHNEDEYSYVIRGRLGALLGDEVLEAGPGTWVFKPRNQWHTFWNAGDEECEIIEVIAPGGFEDFFREISAAPGDMERFMELCAKYELDMQLDSVPGLCERFGLVFNNLD